MKAYTAYDLLDARILMEQKKFEEAYNLLMEVYDHTKNILNIESPFLFYLLALCQANLGYHYKAVEWAQKGKKADPLNCDVNNLYFTMLTTIEESVIDLVPYGLEKKEEVEKIYQFLLEKGHIRNTLQFCMIRFYIKINELEPAREMLENYLVTNPNDEDAKFMKTCMDSFGVKGNLSQKARVKAA